MPRRKKLDYKPRFARELGNGMRLEGKSIPEICSEWNITVDRYETWVRDYPEFEQAHKKGERDSAAFWYKLYREAAQGKVDSKPELIKFAMKNIDGVNWSDKVEVHKTSEEEIRTIKIEILPSQPEIRTIEHDDSEHIIDVEPS